MMVHGLHFRRPNHQPDHAIWQTHMDCYLVAGVLPDTTHGTTTHTAYRCARTGGPGTEEAGWHVPMCRVFLVLRRRCQMTTNTGSLMHLSRKWKPKLHFILKTYQNPDKRNFGTITTLETVSGV